jgi:hypothetical protein
MESQNSETTISTGNTFKGQLIAAVNCCNPVPLLVALHLHVHLHVHVHIPPMAVTGKVFISLIGEGGFVYMEQIL